LLSAICVDGDAGDIGVAIRRAATSGAPLSIRGHFITLDRRSKKGSFHVTPLRPGAEGQQRIAIIISDWRDNGDARRVA
jgi:hypothetical protein